MTRPPIQQPRPPGAGPIDEEGLDELGDDAIVAQQAVHAPQPRATVDMESRTIVVAEDEPQALDPSEVMATRQLPQYAGQELTVAAQRRAASRAPTMVLPRSALAIRPKRKRNWVVIGIWVAAGIVAFGFGGILAVLTARGAASTPQAQPITTVVVPVATPAPKPVPVATETKPVVPEPIEAEAVTTQELPVEPAKLPEPPKKKKPRPVAAPKPTATATATAAPIKRDPNVIPEGI